MQRRQDAASVKVSGLAEMPIVRGWMISTGRSAGKEEKKDCEGICFCKAVRAQRDWGTLRACLQRGNVQAGGK